MPYSLTSKINSQEGSSIVMVPGDVPPARVGEGGASCEGALRQRNTREFYSSNLRAVGPKHAQ